MVDARCVSFVGELRGLGCVVFRADLPPGDVLAVIVSCPRWYFGQKPYLTCMMPPEAAATAKTLGLPRVSPDSLLGLGQDHDG